MSDIGIYICAHNTIKNYYPNIEGYIIAAQNENVKSEDIPILYMNDKFTNAHNICYGEVCQIRWMLNHPELLPEYVGLNHYRRFFDEFKDDLSGIYTIIGEHGAIFPKTWTSGLNNKTNIALYHSHLYYDAMKDAIHKVDSSYDEAFQDFSEDAIASYCNMFIMRKQDFLECARFVIDVLCEFDRSFGIDGNDSVLKFVTEEHDKGHWFKGSISWQARLEGFIAEYLWDVVRRKRFHNAYLAKMLIAGERDDKIKSNE